MLGANSSACITRSHVVLSVGISKHLARMDRNGLVIVECLYSHSDVRALIYSVVIEPA